MQNSFAVVSVMLRTLDIWVVGFLGAWVFGCHAHACVSMFRWVGNWVKAVRLFILYPKFDEKNLESFWGNDRH